MHQYFAQFMIQKQIDEIKNLQDVTRHNLRFVEWYDNSKKILKNVFGENSRELNEFSKIRFWPGPESGMEREDIRKIYLSGLEQANNLLLSFLEREVCP